MIAVSLVQEIWRFIDISYIFNNLLVYLHNLLFSGFSRCFSDALAIINVYVKICTLEPD